ncbi:biotin transporter BioY [Collinsella tanakaei]|uniref:biotin transporter BioY n=1 Tax=Collinsella tanakaei TaxID=626935 RepID=UPI00195B61B5|nr:biotin transporter BioY [Collinsella tanakaei]MBM6867404.1 biotin transporter BioY [Collinsella tanakaei]
MNVQQLARAGVSVALLAVAAWVTVPIGPVPFTLQTMALAILPAALDRKTACAAVAVYLLLGAIGLPVFSGFGGGIASIAGPTGGFLWGFMLGTLAGTTVESLLPARVPLFARSLAASATMLAVSYACGAVQLMIIGSMDAAAALAVAVLPFVIPDAVKLAVGTSIGCSVARATGHIAQHA